LHGLSQGLQGLSQGLHGLSQGLHGLLHGLSQGLSHGLLHGLSQGLQGLLLLRLLFARQNIILDTRMKQGLAVDELAEFVKRCELTPDNVMRFARTARELWESDPEQMHKLEFEMRQRVLRVAGKKVASVAPAALTEMCATLARLGAARGLTRWFA
jgi:hypothetical protein